MNICRTYFIKSIISGGYNIMEARNNTFVGHFDDHFGMKDTVGAGLRGELIIGVNRIIEEYINPFGQKSYRTKFGETLWRGKNQVLIGGYQYVFNKLFNIRPDTNSTLVVGNLNYEAPQMKIGVSRDAYISGNYNAEFNTLKPNDAAYPIMDGINISAHDTIFGFMVGNGGAKSDNITAIAPDYKRRMLYNTIPFRMSNDGKEIDQGKYFGKFVSNNGTESYYVKKFDNPEPHIVHSWVTDDDDEFEPVDESVYNSTSSIPIESYVEMNITIDKNDLRGYATSTNTTCLMNELGLVSGWYNPLVGDYERITLITHLTRSSIPLTPGDKIEAQYRLYSR